MKSLLIVLSTFFIFLFTSVRYREMQLESTLFGICVVQIRPLLERLMKVPSGALIKEIQLNENLLELLTTYQVPSDLLSYSGPHDTPTMGKVTYLKGQVQKMQNVVQEAKAAQLEEAKIAQELRLVTNDDFYESPPPPSVEPPQIEPSPPPSIEREVISPRKKEKFFSNLIKKVAAPFKKKEEPLVKTYGDGGPLYLSDPSTPLRP